MPATATRYRKTRKSALASYTDRVLVTIGDTEAACTFINEGGEAFVTSAIVELPGAGGRVGVVQPADEARTRWIVGAGHGWVDAEFATVHDAVAALRDPKVRAAMQQQTDLRRQLATLQAKARALPSIPGALPVDGDA